METGALNICFAQFASGFDTFEDRRTFLAQHPELLSKTAINEANALIQDWRERGILQPLFQLRLFRNLLQCALDMGVDKAFHEFCAPTEKAHKVVMDLLRADDPEELWLILFHQKRLLSTPAATSVFHHLRAEYEDNPEKMRRIEAAWDAVGMFDPSRKPSRANASASTRTLLDENAVIAALETAFLSRGFTVVSKCSTDETGIDLHARDPQGTEWLVEAKGETSSKRTSKKFGEPFDNAQINVHIGVAILKTMALRHAHPQARVAIALVDEPKHRARIASIGDSLNRLNIEILWVHPTGQVPLPSPTK